MTLNFTNVKVASQNGRDARTPGKRLIDSSVTTSLFVPFDQFTTLDTEDRASSIVSVKGANTLVQATAGRRPLRQPAAANGYPGLFFQRATRADYLTVNTRPDTSGEFSMALVYRPKLAETNQGLIASLVSGTDRIGIQQTTDSDIGGVFVGNAQTFFDPTINEWCCIILAKDATHYWTRFNGVLSAPTAHNNATGGSAPFVLGALALNNSHANIDVAKLWFGNKNVLNGDHDDVLEAIDDYCLKYGIGA